MFERYIDSRFRERAYRVEKDAATGKLWLVVDQSHCCCSTSKNCWARWSAMARVRPRLSDFDCELPLSGDRHDMDKRIEFLDREGLAAQVIYPTVGLLVPGCRGALFDFLR